MSTRIYPAYRTKARVDLWILVAALRKRVENEIRKVLKKEFPQVGATRAEAYHFLADEFRKQHPKGLKHPYGMDVSLTIREWNGRFYLLPCANGIMEGVWDFLPRNMSLKDFHYQNSTDKPNSVTTIEWEYRKGVWEELGVPDSHLSSSKWWNALTLDILNPDSFFRVAYFLIKDEK